jgi:hypothetical protein
MVKKGTFAGKVVSHDLQQGCDNTIVDFEPRRYEESVAFLSAVT